MLYARGIIYKAACMVLITITMVVSVSAASVTEVRAAENRRGYRYSITIGKYRSGTTVPAGKKLKLSCRGYKKKSGSRKRTALRYRSSNTGIASVSSKGIVRGKKNGKVTITVYCREKRSVRKKITIFVGKRIRRIEINGLRYLRPGRKVELKADVYPSDAANGKVKWTTSDPKVVTVDKSGRIVTKRAGKAVVTARAVDGSEVRDKYTVTVFKLKRKDAKWVAHRGLHGDSISGGITENTVEAFRMAGMAHFWGAECDIWETKRDGNGEFDLVVHHDESYKKIYGHNKNVWDVTADEARSISSDICFLKDYLEICKEYGMVPVIEIKATSKGRHTITAEGVDKMLDIIETVYGRDRMPEMLDSENGDAIHFISYGADALNLIKTAARDRYGILPYLGFLIKNEVDEGIMIASASGNQFTAVDIMKKNVTGAVYEECAARGLMLGAWSYKDCAEDDDLLYRHILSGKIVIEVATSDNVLFD